MAFFYCLPMGEKSLARVAKVLAVTDSQLLF